MLRVNVERLRRCVGAVCAGLLAVAALAQTPGPRGDAETEESGDPALASYLAGNGLLNRGLHDLAAAEYRQFLDAHAKHAKAPLARYGLAVCLVRLNQSAEAADLLVQLRKVRDFQFAAEVATLLGQTLLAQQRYADAAAAFEVVGARFAEHDLADDAAAGLVEARYRAGEHAEAATACRAFGARWPKSALLERVEFVGALSEMTAGEHVAAAARFARVVERQPAGPLAEQATFFAARSWQQSAALDKAEPGYRAIIALPQSKHRADAFYGLATVCAATQRAAEAGELLDRLLTEYADSPLVAAARYERARVHFAQEQFDRALPLFEQATQDGGDLADDAAYWAAKCRLRGGDAAGAAERLAALAQAQPESNLAAEIAYDLAVALSRTERFAEAATALEQFLRSHARHALAADALYLLAACEQQTRQFERSLSHCSAFLKAHPQHVQAAAVRLLAADCEFSAGKYAEAAERYARVLEDKPAAEVAQRAQLHRGLALFQIEKLDEAQAALSEIAAKADRDAAFRPALLALGEIAFQRRDWPAAEAQLARYVADGNDAASTDDALLKLGIARQRQARHAQALEAFDRLLTEFRTSPHRAQALFERGQALAALERDAEAIVAFEALANEQDAERFRAYAHYHLGVLAQRRGDAHHAAERFAAALRAEPDAAVAADARLQRGIALLAAGEDKDAATALAEFIEKHGDDARVSEARARLALALGRLDRPDEALATIERLSTGELAGLDEALRAAVQYQRATGLRTANKHDDAASALREIVAAEGPLSLHAALDLAEIDMAAKRYDAAAATLREARARSGQDGTLARELAEPLLYRLGVCAFELKQWDDAVKALEALLAANADSKLAASASFFAGEAHYQAGRHGRAVEHLSRAAEKYGESADAAPALLRLGDATAAIQQWARSEQVFGDYLARYGKADVAYQARFGVGWARENLGRFDEAIDAYRAVVAAHQGPTAARAQFQIGECLFAKKQYEEAVRELLKVDILFAYPEWSAAALYEAGRCFEALNKTGEARQHFEQVTQKFADTRWATLAGERLAARAKDVPPGK